ncbi:MAG TPA: c-type cytochrome [Solirubrobacterales bacterium]|jgi:mono/diheme cytochrome c family protein|nr:c-type cytochrome [Solirubrobacterales bacterium]
MSHETLFFICGGILAVSAVTVAVIGLKKEDFPGKLMPVVIAWFGIFAIATGTFAVLHGKDDSKDHNAQYAKASEEIEKAETSGPFEEAELAKAEEEEAAEPEAEEESEQGSEASEEAEAGPEGGAEQEGEAGEELEGEAGATAPGGDAEAGTVVFSENCSVCHGATGHGGNGGPDLRTMPLAQSEKGAIQQVTNGGGGMPPFAGTLSEEEIENVAAYVAQDITEGEPKK